MMDAVTISDLFTRWDVPWIVTSELALTAAIYVRGWVRIRRTRPEQFPIWRLACFLGGIAALFVAVASPLDVFDDTLLFMHMGQHFLLMSVAPPLIIAGAPIVPMLRGLPRWVIRLLRPLFASHALLAAGRFLTRMRFAWLIMATAYIGWHIPAAYELTLRSENWHNFEHACFFFTNLLFWWPIIRPWPFRPLQSRWILIPYLLAADVVNTAISAFLCFSGRVLYPSYAAIIPRPFGLSALNDQVAAGAFMWICGSMVYFIPAIVVVLQILSPQQSQWTGIEPLPGGQREDSAPLLN